MQLEIPHFQTNYWSNYEWIHYIRKNNYKHEKVPGKKIMRIIGNHAFRYACIRSDTHAFVQICMYSFRYACIRSDTHALIELDIIIMCIWTYDLRVNSPENLLLLLLLPGYESDSVVTECVWLGGMNNQTGCPSKTGKSPKRWMVYTNKNHVQYIHRTAALSFICVVMKARRWNSTWP